jgi:hypothetical protein
LLTIAFEEDKYVASGKTTNSVVKTEAQTDRKKTKKIGKTHIQGFIAGILVGAILVSGIFTVIYPGILTGNMSVKAQIEQQIPSVDVSANPGSMNAGHSIKASFVLDVPADKLKGVNKDDIYLSGFFEGMETTEVKTQDGGLVVSIQGTSSIDKVYDSGTRYDGFITVSGHESNTAYTACVSAVYPRLTSGIEAIEYQDTYNTDISLTLADDSFVKTPSESDISLDGIFKGMQVSDISQDGNNLSFHLSGPRCEDQVNGQLWVSHNVLESGLSVEKIISVTDALELYSITPITIETPFEDTLILRVSNDYFSEDISADMLTLGEGLKNAKISSVEYIDSTSVSVSMCADELSDAGYGTISLAKGALQSGRTATAQISIESPFISFQTGDDEIMAAQPGKQKEYVLTVYSGGNDFLPTMTPQDFLLEGTLAPLKISQVTWINGYKIELTLQGAPVAGEGFISVSSSEFGGISGAKCAVTVKDSAELFGRVNLSEYLPNMTVTFCDENGNALDIPSATTDERGGFLITVAPDMPVDAIAVVKAQNDDMLLAAPFDWGHREDIHINAFTTLMAESIADAATREEGIKSVYKYLGFEGSSYTQTNLGFIGANPIFSHELFVEQANGDINGFIGQLEEEMKAGKTHSFADTAELSGETGSLVTKIAEWGLGKLKDVAKDALGAAAKEGSLVLLRKAGILEPSTDEMIKDLQKSVDALSDQVKMMRDQVIHEIKLAEMQKKMDDLSKELNSIRFLYAKYVGLKGEIESEVDRYNQNHPDRSEPIVYSELPVTNAFFGVDGEVSKEKLDKCINNIIDTLNGSPYSKPLITQYYDSLTKSMPFAHNAAAELYNFMHYVTSIETIGMSLYSAHCLHSNDTVLKSNLNTLTKIYEESITKQEADILPNKSVFKTDINGKNTTTVKLNHNGKYYIFSDVSYKMKDDYIHRSHKVSMGLSMTRYTLGFEVKDLSQQDITDLFYCRDLNNSKLSRKEYLKKYLGLNLPDWVVFNTKDTYKKTKYVRDHGYDITFYDMGDNKYREYTATDLYHNYGNWVAASITVTQ